jgi:hypothetical protein
VDATTPPLAKVRFPEGQAEGSLVEARRKSLGTWESVHSGIGTSGAL